MFHRVGHGLLRRFDSGLETGAQGCVVSNHGFDLNSVDILHIVSHRKELCPEALFELRAPLLDIASQLALLAAGEVARLGRVVGSHPDGVEGLQDRVVESADQFDTGLVGCNGRLLAGLFLATKWR